jgi:hypothetical protein
MVKCVGRVSSPVQNKDLMKVRREFLGKEKDIHLSSCPSIVRILYDLSK